MPVHATFLIAVGSTGVRVGHRLIAVGSHAQPGRAFRLCDTDRASLNGLPPEMSLYLGGCHVAEIARRPAEHPTLLADLWAEGLRAHPETLEAGGTGNRQATTLTLRWHAAELHSALHGALTQLLRNADVLERLDVVILSTPVGTTGGGAMAEVGIALEGCLAELGLRGRTTTTLLLLSSEGAAPEAPRQLLEAQCLRELEQLALHRTALPRPHDLLRPRWSGGLPWDRTVLMSAVADGWGLSNFSELEQYVAAWLSLTFFSDAVRTQLASHRVRFQPLLYRRDADPDSPRPTFLSFSGVAGYSLGLESVRRYGEELFIARVLELLIGEAREDPLGPLKAQIQLQPGVLQHQMGLPSTQAAIRKNVQVVRNHLQERHPSQWRAILETRTTELQRLLQHLRRVLLQERRTLTARLLALLSELHARAAQESLRLGVTFLRDLESQLDAGRTQAGEQLATLQDVAVKEKLLLDLARWTHGLRLWKREPQLEQICAGLLDAFEGGVRALYWSETLALLEQLLGSVRHRLAETETLIARAEDALQQAKVRRDAAPRQRIESETIQVLTEQAGPRADYDELLSGIVTEERVRTLRQGWVATMSREGDVLALSACTTPEAMVETLRSCLNRLGWLEALREAPFERFFHRAFPDQQRRREAYAWLLARSRPPGGVVSAAALRMERVAPPEGYLALFVPHALAEEATEYLAALAPKLSAVIIPMDGLGCLLAVKEEFGYALYQKVGLADYDGRLERAPLRQRRTLASCDTTSSLPSFVLPVTEETEPAEPAPTPSPDGRVPGYLEPEGQRL